MDEPRATILLVEDDQADLDWDLRLLRRLGLSQAVRVARDGAEAVAYLFPADPPGPARDDLPRLILLDMHLPKLDGFEVLRRIRAEPRLRRVPVVALSGSVLAGELPELGGTRYLVKPIEQEQLLQLLRALHLEDLLPRDQRPPAAPRG
jgi:two-component system response regulator